MIKVMGERLILIVMVPAWVTFSRLICVMLHDELVHMEKLNPILTCISEQPDRGLSCQPGKSSCKMLKGLN